jgi:CBS domain-containing protein
MQVKDIMNIDVIVCSPDTTISEASQLLKKHNISGLPVVEEGRVVGIVSEGDLLKLLDVPEHSGLWLPSPFEVIEIPIRELLNGKRQSICWMILALNLSVRSCKRMCM